MMTQDHHLTPYPNMFIGGAWSGGGGQTTVYMAGNKAAEEIIELEDLREQKAKIAEERAALQKQQKNAQSKLERSERHEITFDKLGDISAHFQRAMAKADFATREEIVNLLVQSVALYKQKAVVKGFIPMTTADALAKTPFQDVFH